MKVNMITWTSDYSTSKLRTRISLSKDYLNLEVDRITGYDIPTHSAVFVPEFGFEINSFKNIKELISIFSCFLLDIKEFVFYLEQNKKLLENSIPQIKNKNENPILDIMNLIQDDIINNKNDIQK